MFFLGVLQFSPHLLIGPSHMSRNNLERDIKLNKKKKINKKINKTNKQEIWSMHFKDFLINICNQQTRSRGYNTGKCVSDILTGPKPADVQKDTKRSNF